MSKTLVTSVVALNLIWVANASAEGADGQSVRLPVYVGVIQNEGDWPTPDEIESMFAVLSNTILSALEKGSADTLPIREEAAVVGSLGTMGLLEQRSVIENFAATVVTEGPDLKGIASALMYLSVAGHLQPATVERLNSFLRDEKSDVAKLALIIDAKNFFTGADELKIPTSVYGRVFQHRWDTLQSNEAKVTGLDGSRLVAVAEPVLINSYPDEQAKVILQRLVDLYQKMDVGPSIGVGRFGGELAAVASRLRNRDDGSTVDLLFPILLDKLEKMPEGISDNAKTSLFDGLSVLIINSPLDEAQLKLLDQTVRQEQQDVVVQMQLVQLAQFAGLSGFSDILRPILADVSVASREWYLVLGAVEGSGDKSLVKRLVEQLKDMDPTHPLRDAPAGELFPESPLKFLVMTIKRLADADFEVSSPGATQEAVLKWWDRHKHEDWFQS